MTFWKQFFIWKQFFNWKQFFLKATHHHHLWRLVVILRGRTPRVVSITCSFSIAAILSSPTLSKSNWCHNFFKMFAQKSFLNKFLTTCVSTFWNLFKVSWLNNYHAQCREIVGAELKKQGRTEALAWMYRETEPLGWAERLSKSILIIRLKTHHLMAISSCQSIVLKGMLNSYFSHNNCQWI